MRSKIEFPNKSWFSLFLGIALLLVLFATTGQSDASVNQYAPKGDGFHTVGVDIAPGLWRSSGINDGCFWQRLNSYDEIHDDHYGFAGGSVRIRPNDDRVYFLGCSTWFFVEGEPKIQKPTAFDDKPSGFYTVGVDISPGQWRAIEPRQDCFRTRLNDDQSVIEHRFGPTSNFVTIAPTDYEVELDNCGKWVYEGGAPVGSGSQAPAANPGSTTGCVIPSSGPWPPCATGNNQPANNGSCVIPPSGPWPACATGGSQPGSGACIIPPSGPWPACARTLR